MGFFKDFKDDFSQAVGELFPGDSFEDEETIQVNTLDNELDVEQELSKLDGLLEQVERKSARSEATRTGAPDQSTAPEKKPESESKTEPEIKKEAEKKPQSGKEPEKKTEIEREAEEKAQSLALLKNMSEERPQPELAPLVFDEPEADGLPAAAPEPEAERGLKEKPAGPGPVQETREPEAEKKPDEKPPEAGKKPSVPKPQPERKPQPVYKPASVPTAQKPAVSEPVAPKPASEPVTKGPAVSAAQRTRAASMPVRPAGPAAAGQRVRPASGAWVEPATVQRKAADRMQTNRSANIKEEKSMDTTVTAAETPVVETPAESAVTNEPMAAPVEVTDEVSLITAGTNIRGNMETTGSFEIEGRIEGDIKCNGKLTVIGSVVGNSASSEFFADAAHIEGEVVSSGTVKIGLGSVIIGNISATSAVIAGAVKGDIDVQGPVVVDTSAVIMGNIKSRSVQINNGAVIEGFCSQCYSDVDVESLFDKK